MSHCTEIISTVYLHAVIPPLENDFTLATGFIPFAITSHDEHASEIANIKFSLLAFILSLGFGSLSAVNDPVVQGCECTSFRRRKHVTLTIDSKKTTKTLGQTQDNLIHD
jgi:hypothetical protein